jgi:hypothetical protein
MAVLLSGLVVLAGVQFGGDQTSTAEPPAVVTTLPRPTVTTTVPSVAGLDPVITRVLAAAGKLQTLAPDQPGLFPPEVARVLAANGVPLLVPEPAGETP